MFGVPEEQIELVAQEPGRSADAGRAARHQRQGADDATVSGRRNRHSARRRSRQSLRQQRRSHDDRAAGPPVHVGERLRGRPGQGRCGARDGDQFPYLDQDDTRKVEYVASEVSKDTRAIMLRASVPNIDGKLKADMLVRAISRFRRRGPDGDSASGDGRHERRRICVRPERAEQCRLRIEQFERRQLVVAEERDDHVVVKGG